MLEMEEAAYYGGNRTIQVGACEKLVPGAGRVQIRVSHCGICGTDLHLFRGEMDHRMRLPQVFGHEMSGVVAAIGEGVEGFAAGDHVTVRPLAPCGSCATCRAGYSHICPRLKFIGIDAPGALQAFWTVPAHTLHRLPTRLPLETAALVEPLSVACHDVRLAGLEKGEYVVVQGGGPIGTLIALVSRHAGARVLVSEVNPFRLQLARELGLEALNPKTDDLVARVKDETEGTGASVVFEVSGSAAGAETMTKLARPRGRIVVVAIFAEPPKVNLFECFWRELKVSGARVYEAQDFEAAIALADSGKLPLDRLISAVHPLNGVESALRRLESGGDVMKILIQCSEAITSRGSVPR
jgi:(R,R)-butanediol dehydrogenase / meso-butanediol dehydrogenase / diacetyl reductase